MFIAFFAIIGCLYSTNASFPMLPFAIEPTATALLLFLIGHWFSKILSVKIICLPGNIIILMFLIQVLLLKANGTVDMRSARYYNGYIFFIGAFYGTLVFWNISNALLRHNTYLANILEFISKYSLIYLSTNYFILILVSNITVNIN